MMYSLLLALVVCQQLVPAAEACSPPGGYLIQDDSLGVQYDPRFQPVADPTLLYCQRYADEYRYYCQFVPQSPANKYQNEIIRSCGVYAATCSQLQQQLQQQQALLPANDVVQPAFGAQQANRPLLPQGRPQPFIGPSQPLAPQSSLPSIGDALPPVDSLPQLPPEGLLAAAAGDVRTIRAQDLPIQLQDDNAVLSDPGLSGKQAHRVFHEYPEWQLAALDGQSRSSLVDCFKACTDRACYRACDCQFRQPMMSQFCSRPDLPASSQPNCERWRVLCGLK